MRGDKFSGMWVFHGIGFKVLLIVLSLSLVLCGIIGGTLAYLVARTAPVTNTFTYGDINITLTESDSGDGDNDPNTNTYNMVPGGIITKDPIVTVKANSEDSWLFVKLEKTENFDDFMEFTVAEGWTALAGVDGVYYREVDSPAADTGFYVIADNTVKVKGTVTKEMLNSLDVDGNTNYPKLIITAYAIQRDADIEDINTAEKAWDLID